ncbi:MAG: hypothetical protein ACHQF2_08695 [Flavobacteriales bacterium]
MKKGLVLLVLLLVFSCSDESRRNEVLTKSGELEVAWNSLDLECTALLDTLKAVINPWVNDSLPDSIPKPDKRAFQRSDSLMKTLTASLNGLQKQFIEYESKVILIKNNLLSFLSWKLLVNNKDIEISTASDDLKKHKKLFKKLSLDARRTYRITTADLASFRAFVGQVNNKTVKDTLQNEQP